MVRAFITGITGQDGSYLTEYLLDRKYEVHGLIRPGSDISSTHINKHASDIGLHMGDLADREALKRAMAAVAPDEVYPAILVTMYAVSSYLTFSPSPFLTKL